MKKLKKENQLEQYERNLAILGLFVFIFIGVAFITLVLPGIYEISGLKTKGKSSNLITYQNNRENDGYKLGLDSFKKNNYSEALNYFQKAVDTDPNNINYLTELATTHYRLKNYDEAIRTYNKIISIEKNDSFAYNNIGNIYSIKNDYANAESYFRKAIEIDPCSIPSYSNLALMFDENNRKDDAIEVLKQGIEANPNSFELKITLKIVEE